jgi:PAS domain S-box-containing protein
MNRNSILDDEGKKHSLFRPSSSLLSSGQVTLRLVLAFIFLAALLIVAGDLGLRRLDRINADLQDTTSKQWAKLRLSREAWTYSNRSNHITMQVFLIKDRKQIDSLLAEREENTHKITTMLTRLVRLSESMEEKRLLTAVVDARGPYIASYLQAMRLLFVEQKREEAKDVMLRQTTPALLQYHDAWQEFVHFQEDQLARAVEQSRTNYAVARGMALLIIIIAVVAPCLVALFIIRRMIREITACLCDEKEELRAAHQRAEVFINIVPSILIGLDRDLRITRWNLAAAEEFGLSREEVAGKQLTDSGIVWLRPGMQDEIRSWCSEQAVRRFDQVPFELNGKTRLLGLTVTSVHALDDSKTKLLVVGTDITTRYALEEQLHQAQKLESIGQLAAGIAHEINTPTQYIGDNVQFLKDAFQDLRSQIENYERLLQAAKGNSLSIKTVEEVSAAIERVDGGYLISEVPKAIEQCMEGVTRVASLVNAMRDFSHPAKIEKIEVDLRRAIESTIAVSRNEWKYVADLETDFDAALPMVPCQPGEFNQVILNLIVNAAHAIADVIQLGGAQRGKITVRTHGCPEWAEIRIQDTGTGIPEKVRARIFDPFFTTKEIGKGTGQGLSIARSVVVDKHGGSIHFETEVGRGTTFIIRLPYDGKTLAPMAVAA